MKRRNFKKPVKGQLMTEDEYLIKRYFEVSADADDSEGSTSFNKEGVYDRIKQTLEKSEKAVKVRKFWKYAVSAAVLAGAFFVAGYLHFQSKSNFQNIAFKHQETQRGHISKMELPDGTLVWLNAGSKLSFPENFSENKREVTLEGEAYFEVKHETHRPFLVHTQSVVTQVLGTTFNVRSYAESGRIKVSVLSGKVAVYETDKAGKNITPQPLMITANQEVIYSKLNHQLAYNIKEVISAEAAAWKEGNLVFKNTELSEVIDALERRYNIHVALDSALLNCPVTVNFNNESVKQVMQILPHLVEGKLTESKGTYRLSGVGCQ